MKPVRVVCGTRASDEDFFLKSATGISLVTHQYFNPFELRLFSKNSQGLSTIYNIAIEEARESPAILVFVHDDVHFCDVQWSHQIAEAVRMFDIVGVAGNARRVPRQPSWLFIDEHFTGDEKRFLSGIVGNGKGFPYEISNFGPSRRACKLLDGLLLAVDSDRLIQSGVRFDEQFDFHFYDLDFCRQAELAHLTMGTWPLSVVHGSNGDFRSPGWRHMLTRYREKYAD
ncbi:glycosyltransferase [Caballeronia sp. BR00000012568055]|uniref:glycosyltransferase n=1 Tax=Caballeronia sp. BR00000012568055 TaxID=2918761 RepID=UPI0023F97746|nr:glycosyltransferase [Caballeronia sp. BR00000012568055]